MADKHMNDGWINLKDSVHGQNTLSWATSTSSTRVSTVDGLSFSENFDTDIVDSVGSLLSVIQRMNLNRFPANFIQTIRVVGEGEAFSVFESKFQGETIAVKRIRLHESNGNVGRAVFQRRLQAVLRETLIMNHAPLAHHPNIMHFLGYGWDLEEERLSLFITMEFAPAGSLRNYLQSSKRPFRAKEILAGDIATGLMALHKCGIVHGDLKLDNVLVVPSLDRPSMVVARVADFDHSIILTSASEATIVRRQKKQPIPAEQLHKCDIWAFGLGVWEILADGQVYFRRSWRRDPTYHRSISFPGPLGGVECRSDVEREPRSDTTSEPLLGKFDLFHLKEVAKIFLGTLQMPEVGLETKFLLALFEHTLQVDPAQRLSDLSRLPIVTVWQKAARGHSLQVELAVLAMTNEIKYSMFTSGNNMHIPWEHRRLLQKELEIEATSGCSSKNTTTAAFQVMLCYANAFGTSRDYGKATEFLRQATGAGHILARVFGERIEDGLLQRRAKPLPSYTDCLALGFRWLNQVDKSSSITVHTTTSIFEFPDYITFRDTLDLDFASTSARYGDITDIIVRAAGLSSRYSILELAICQNDTRLAKAILSTVPEKVTSTKINQELLICRTACSGALGTLGLLMECWETLNPLDPSPILQWLFCFSGTDLEELVRIVKKTWGESPRLMKSLNRSMTVSGGVLHPQWPFQVQGTPLATAISSGNTTVVQALLEHGANPLAPAFSSEEQAIADWTPLYEAVKYNFPDIFSLLWRYAFPPGGKVSIDTVHASSHHRRFLLACALSLLTNAERLAIHGGDYLEGLQQTVRLLPFSLLQQQAPDGRTAITQAIDLGDIDTLEALLNHCPELANTQIKTPGNGSLYTYPLHFATQICSTRESESIQIIQSILEIDPQAIDRPDASSFKPIHIAAMGTSVAVPLLLLERGASPGSKDGLGRTPLHVCRTASIVHLLHNYGAELNHQDLIGHTPTYTAAGQGLADVLQALIQCGANISITDHERNSALHHATEARYHGPAKILIKAGIHVDAQNQHKQTALHFALNSGQHDLAHTLLEYGANPFVRDTSTTSPFVIALTFPGITTLRVILEHYGTCFLPRDVLTNTLLVAAEFGTPEALTLYLEFLRPILVEHNARDRITGLPAVHRAVTAYREDLVRVLLAHGFDINNLDSEGNTPLILVCSTARERLTGSNAAKRDATCEYLLHKGGNILAANKGRTPFLIALGNKDFSLMTLLLRHYFTSNLES
ncbi:hypothetical protein BDW74DRAFT_180863 [Aspergillus multicolor]|uniref:uncharacterized protein n=1 Tax=Aspergillus multicolor TaxID=41759 RepID=UPI003CCCE726